MKNPPLRKENPPKAPARSPLQCRSFLGARKHVVSEFQLWSGWSGAWSVDWWLLTLLRWRACQHHSEIQTNSVCLPCFSALCFGILGEEEKFTNLNKSGNSRGMSSFWSNEFPSGNESHGSTNSNTLAKTNSRIVSQQHRFSGAFAVRFLEGNLQLQVDN